MIDLLDLRDKTGIEEITKILVPEEDGTFEIYVPKSTQEFFSDPNEVAMDYAQLAYAGQLLKNICQEFNYEFVHPTEHESVLFTLKNLDVDELANALIELSYYYGLNDFEDEEEFTYEDIDQYIGDVNDGKTEAACPDFVEVCNEFFKRAEETGEE
jgi:hypothetical protein